MREIVTGFTPVDQRIRVLRLKGKFFNYSLVSCHSPNRMYTREDKEGFYDPLDRTLDSCPTNDTQTILGDLNEKIGKARKWMILLPETN